MKHKFLIIFVILLTFIIGINGQSFSKKFDFGIGKTAEGYESVSTINSYSKETGYGFEDVTGITCISRNDKNLLLSGFCSSEKPFYFSVAVPEGNFRVKITFGDFNESTETTVKAELRRLMLENVETKKGKFKTETFIVNVRRPEISTGGAVKLKDREKLLEAWAWDEKLTLEFNGKKPNVNAIELEKIDSLPTVYLLGDSTVCDQPGEPYASWGQMLTAFFNNQIVLANHAESGESLKSSFGAKRLEKVLSVIKPGDYVLIQYAHNDEKEKGDGIGAMTSFKASLLQWIDAIKAKGGNPILITPMHRRTFDKDGKITNSHGDYPEATRQAAKEKGVPLIDLTEMSKDLYEYFGKDGSGVLFKDGDGTHHNNFGAYELAKLVATALKQQKLPLSKYLKKEFKPLDPQKPDSPESLKIPASPNYQNTKPLGS
ncbi:MAG: rhamnogalacturonan acetylesterase [Pyrinomonadaceae bacterium]|nr:rhamnogalacturonan acetylesterase [Pyrinomonadaceae bacterium]